MRAITLFTMLALLCSAGCYKYSIKVGQGGNTASAPSKSVWNHHFIAGVAGDGAIDVSSVCPSGNATVKIERNLIDSVLGNVTGAVLWSPSTIEVYCGGGIAQLEFGDAEQREFAKSELFKEAVVALAPERLPEAEALSL